jgi:hypothetical protein
MVGHRKYKKYFSIMSFILLRLTVDIQPKFSKELNASITRKKYLNFDIEPLRTKVTNF